MTSVGWGGGVLVPGGGGKGWGLGGPDSRGGLEGGPGEPEVVAVD